MSRGNSQVNRNYECATKMAECADFVVEHLGSHAHFQVRWGQFWATVRLDRNGDVSCGSFNRNFSPWGSSASVFSELLRQWKSEGEPKAD